MPSEQRTPEDSQSNRARSLPARVLFSKTTVGSKRCLLFSRVRTDLSSVRNDFHQRKEKEE